MDGGQLGITHAVAGLKEVGLGLDCCCGGNREEKGEGGEDELHFDGGELDTSRAVVAGLNLIETFDEDI